MVDRGEGTAPAEGRAGSHLCGTLERLAGALGVEVSRSGRLTADSVAY